jgi:uncharacterized protein
MRRTLVLFARVPALGAGKRRLAREVGEVAAWRFERLMLALMLRRLGHDRRWRLRLATTPDRAALRLARYHAGVERVDQGGGDLGIRMRRAIAQCPPGPVVLVGADIPSVAPRHIAEAFRRLGQCDLVFGPAEDGGFWLVGARRRPRLPPLFGRVRWSSPEAFADTLANLPRDTAVGFVARLEDVDDRDAYRRLAPRRGF